MGHNVAQKLIATHLLSGDMTPGQEIALRIDQTLTQDATGTLVMLELEALGLDRAHTEVSVQYVDHNLLQADSKNAEDHTFLRSACHRFGLWYSKAGQRRLPPDPHAALRHPRQDDGRLRQPHPGGGFAGDAGDRSGRHRGGHGHRR